MSESRISESRRAAIANRPFNPSPEIMNGRGYNDQLPLEIPLEMRLTNVFIEESKASNKEGVFAHFTILTSGMFFTHFNSINEGQEGYIDLMLGHLGGEGRNWAECMEDLKERKPVYEIELYKDPRNPSYIRPRIRRIIKARTTKPREIQAGEVQPIDESDIPV